jgi:uncharacterized protein (DUF488 family)
MTIGHSNRPLEELIGMLQAHGVTTLVDVRTVPKSRHNPQFNREALPAPLEAAGIAYRHMPGLGGLRHAPKDSTNTGWRNASFRGYADYMQTEEFERNLDELLAVPGDVAVMCAEAVPWRCHRSLVGDALLVRGVEVQDITSKTRVQAHKLTQWAKVKGVEITYPGEEAG